MKKESQEVHALENFLALSNEYGTEGVCTASDCTKKIRLKSEEFLMILQKKTCLCMGLAATAVINYQVDTKE